MDPAYANALQGMGLGEGSPGYEIVNAPRDIAMVDHANTRMSMLMGNFFDFGRGPGNWTWQSTLSRANGPNSYNNPAEHGINLLNGMCTATNCDGFRQTFYNLATHVINIPDIKFSEHHFLTYGGLIYDPTTNTTFANEMVHV